ncbi:MAG TPA: methylmalonyl Co-A mutase-associated GTPase MeaB [Bacteroidales bacterium]|nr:methylmalonyl Co-A mutase-associated GTPase MeaB [Bacteroidales bacterium]
MLDHDKFKSALSVNEGVEQPPSVNHDSVKQFVKKARNKLSAQQYIDGIIEGNRTILSQAITLVESSLPAHAHLAQEIVEKCLPYSGKSLRIGITGVPGVGKSSFIEIMGKYLTNAGRKLAVLAIDPSSEKTKGSILGDKTRMESLSADPNAFIRPSPSAGSLGGVARKTRETIILCEASGFDTIFIETVGVGQSETVVHSMVDFFLLLMLAGAGDELQGIKRGIMEMADTIAITKSDGTNVRKAQLAATEYKNALHLFPKSASGWNPRVLLCSSLEGSGIPEIWDSIQDYTKLTQENHYFFNRRREQSKYWMYETIDESIRNHFYHHPLVDKELGNLEEKVLEGQMGSFGAAKKLLQIYFGSK